MCPYTLQTVRMQPFPAWHHAGLQPESPRQSCCRNGDSFQGPRTGSCLTLRNELSEETRVLKKQETVGKGHRVERRTLREPRTALPHGSQPLVLW